MRILSVNSYTWYVVLCDIHTGGCINIAYHKAKYRLNHKAKCRLNQTFCKITDVYVVHDVKFIIIYFDQFTGFTGFTTYN